MLACEQSDLGLVIGDPAHVLIDFGRKISDPARMSGERVTCCLVAGCNTVEFFYRKDPAASRCQKCIRCGVDVQMMSPVQVPPR